MAVSITVALTFLGMLLAERNPTTALVLAFPAAALGLMAIVLSIVARRRAIRLAAAAVSLVLTLPSGFVVAILGLLRVTLIQWAVYFVLILVGAYRIDRERAAEARHKMQDPGSME
jgi:hypothetical protein